MDNRYTAIIPARGGSKGLPRKNVLDLAGRPLISHTIEAALGSNCFESVWVTTDCPEIKSVAVGCGAQVIDRPVELATDNASSLDVITHALKYISHDVNANRFVLLQPTSPLRQAVHIKESIKQFEGGNESKLVSVQKVEDSPFKMIYVEDGSFRPMREWADLTMPRQSLPAAYKPNGAIYIADIYTYLQDQILLDANTGCYLMNSDDSLDIDTDKDFLKVEEIISLNQGVECE